MNNDVIERANKAAEEAIKIINQVPLYMAISFVSGTIVASAIQAITKIFCK